MSNIYITREDFEEWREFFNVKYSREPNRSSSKIEFSATLPETNIKFSFQATAILNENNERYYGRFDDWNEIKISDWALDNFSFFGKGSRAIEVWNEATEMLKLMAPNIAS